MLTRAFEMKRSFSTCLFILIACILPSCGGSASGGGGSSNPFDTGSSAAINSLNPSLVYIDGPAFTLTVNGKNFSPSNSIEWFVDTSSTGTTSYKTTYVSSTELTVAVPASAITQLGYAELLLLNNGQPVSKTRAILTITAPTPHITSISPTSATAGGPGFTLVVNGTNFTPDCAIVWYWSGEGSSQFPPGGSTVFVSSTELTLQIPATAIEYPGLAGVFVVTYDVGDNEIASNSLQLVVNPAPAGVLENISTGLNDAAPNGDSSNPMIDFGGRVITFTSAATNLVNSTPGNSQVYAHDDCLGSTLYNADGFYVPCASSTVLVSALPLGDPANPTAGNGPSLDGQVADEGDTFFSQGAATQFYGFLSASTNLVLPNTTHQQAYLRNSCYFAGVISGCLPATDLISVSSAGTEPNGASTDLSMASQTCNAVYASAATDILAGVTIPNEIYFARCTSNGSTSTYEYTYAFSPIVVVSQDSAGNIANQGASQPATDGGGETTAFVSSSTNLSNIPNGGFQQVFWHDDCTAYSDVNCAPNTVMASVDGSGNALHANSQNPSISEDGRFVTFTALTPQSGGGTVGTVYRYDTCVSYDSYPPQAPNCTPSVSTISLGTGGAAANGSSNSLRYSMSIDGRFVTFDSQATNIILGGNPGGQVFVRDTCAGPTTDVPPPANCTPTTHMVSVSNGVAIGGSQEAISADGHFATFVTTIGGVQQVVLAYTGF